MMKTRTILLIIAFMGCFTDVVAQDVTILHMKDGTTKRYTNGEKDPPLSSSLTMLLRRHTHLIIHRSTRMTMWPSGM